jgi:predicted secreted protein
MVNVDDELNVTAGSSFDLRLEALATAGFRWMPRLTEQDREMLRVVGEGWEPPGASTGGMSYQIFTFEARRPGDVELTFEYARSWEPQPIRTRTFRVHIA